jgi:Ca2+/Na+ antiporter
MARLLRDGQSPSSFEAFTFSVQSRKSKTMLNLLFVVIGVLLLTSGGEALIRGSLAAATRRGVSPLLSGLVIVGFGTSAPELVVSIDAALNDRPDIAIGNVVDNHGGCIGFSTFNCGFPSAIKRSGGNR